MRQNALALGLILVGVVAGGCCHRPTIYPSQSMPDAALLEDPYSVCGPYSIIPGNTTGSGSPVNKQTGGGITGNQVTPRQRLEYYQRMSNVGVTVEPPPIRTDIPAVRNRAP